MNHRHLGKLLTPFRDTSTQDISDNPLRLLHLSITLPSKAWCDQSSERLEKVILCKLSQASGSSTQPLKVTHNLTVNSDLTWKLFVLNHEINTRCTVLDYIPSTLTQDTFSQLLVRLDNLAICVGPPDAHFIRMITAKKGKILSHDGKAVCSVDNGTVRTMDCEILSTSEKCSTCKKYRATLRSYNRWSKKLKSSSGLNDYTNERYLNTPVKKEKIGKLKKRAHAAEQTVANLREKVRKLTECGGDTLDENLHSDMIGIMKENTDGVKSAYPEGSFGRFLWEEQMKAASLSNLKQVRWHPVIIKWCLNQKLLSSSAYHAMRSKLLSEITLRDYTHYSTNTTGFTDEVDDQLMSEIPTSLPASQRNVAVLIDEMNVREGLVNNKFSGEIIGWEILTRIFYDWKMKTHRKLQSRYLY